LPRRPYDRTAVPESSGAAADTGELSSIRHGAGLFLSSSAQSPSSWANTGRRDCGSDSFSQWRESLDAVVDGSAAQIVWSDGGGGPRAEDDARRRPRRARLDVIALSC